MQRIYVKKKGNRMSTIIEKFLKFKRKEEGKEHRPKETYFFSCLAQNFKNVSF